MEQLQLPSPHSQPLSGTLQHPAGVPLQLIPLIVSGVAWRVVDESVRLLAESRSEVYRWRIHSSCNYNARPSACCVAGRRLSDKDLASTTLEMRHTSEPICSCLHLNHECVSPQGDSKRTKSSELPGDIVQNNSREMEFGTLGRCRSELRGDGVKNSGRWRSELQRHEVQNSVEMEFRTLGRWSSKLRGDGVQNSGEMEFRTPGRWSSELWGDGVQNSGEMEFRTPGRWSSELWGDGVQNSGEMEFRTRCLVCL
ncbi:unnamed protein product [Boreogadus saida]